MEINNEIEMVSIAIDDEIEMVSIAIEVEPSIVYDIDAYVETHNNENRLKTFASKVFTKEHIFYSPTFTVVVSIVNVALFIWSMVLNGGFYPPSLNPMLGPSPQTLLICGAKWTPLILMGQWWRLISAMFLHAGIIHLILNIFSQIVFGWYLEKRYGTIICATVYLISGVGGNVTSAVFSPEYLTVGASGGLFGWIGLWLIDIIQNYKKFNKPFILISTMIISIVVTFALGLLPYIDNYAHLGGFLFGLELSIILISNHANLEKGCKKNSRLITTIVMIPIFILNFVGFFLLLYLMPPVSEWCPYCRYFNCIPYIQNGVDWC